MIIIRRFANRMSSVKVKFCRKNRNRTGGKFIKIMPRLFFATYFEMVCSPILQR
jgi:hypothetical protein